MVVVVRIVVDVDPEVVVEAAAGAAAREPTTVLARARPTSSRARDARRGWEDAPWTPLVEPGKTHASYLPEHRGEERDDGARRRPGQTRRMAIHDGIAATERARERELGRPIRGTARYVCLGTTSAIGL